VPGVNGMNEAKEHSRENSNGSYDASDRPFDFIEDGTETALICEPDSSIRSKITDFLQKEGVRITEPASAQEALKNMRFHVYQIMVIDEYYETDDDRNNVILRYLNGLSMGIRRNIFVVLVTRRFRTMDKMAAFNKSVNIVVNVNDIDQFGAILKKGVAEHEAFYHIFKEALRKTGKI
jgi:CheY-like chemotaxis protein